MLIWLIFSSSLFPFKDFSAPLSLWYPCGSECFCSSFLIPCQSLQTVGHSTSQVVGYLTGWDCLLLLSVGSSVNSINPQVLFIYPNDTPLHSHLLMGWHKGISRLSPSSTLSDQLNQRQESLILYCFSREWLLPMFLEETIAVLPLLWLRDGIASHKWAGMQTVSVK